MRRSNFSGNEYAGSGRGAKLQNVSMKVVGVSMLVLLGCGGKALYGEPSPDGVVRDASASNPNEPDAMLHVDAAPLDSSAVADADVPDSGAWLAPLPACIDAGNLVAFEGAPPLRGTWVTSGRPDFASFTMQPVPDARRIELHASTELLHVPMTPGVYNGAQFPPATEGHAYFGVTGGGSLSCDGIAPGASFRIETLAADDAGITSLSLDWELNCEGLARRGCAHYER